MMESLQVVEALLREYEKIFIEKENRPVWAIHKKCAPQELVHCSIPFVGSDYGKQSTKILLYASAENLSGYDGYLDCNEIAMNRHRKWFENSLQNDKNFFPNVHIAPINDGSLTIVAFYIYSKISNLAGNVTPAEFLEKISFGNYCKYTIKSAENKDYANDTDKLKESREYIEKDIHILQPDYIIMPKSIYETERKFIDDVKGKGEIIPIYQINASTVNRIIAGKYPIYKTEKLNEVVYQWYKHLGTNGISGKTKENYLSVFSYLDKVIQTIA